MQAQNGHSPPTSSASIAATFWPALASPRAACLPPGPAPTTTASNRSSALMAPSLVARGEQGREGRRRAVPVGQAHAVAERVSSGDIGAAVAAPAPA